LVLITQFVFLVERATDTHTQTHNVTDASDYSTHALATVGVGNYRIRKKSWYGDVDFVTAYRKSSDVHSAILT